MLFNYHFRIKICIPFQIPLYLLLFLEYLFLILIFIHPSLLSYCTHSHNVFNVLFYLSQGVMGSVALEEQNST
jgi:hypothetical protein